MYAGFDHVCHGRAACLKNDLDVLQHAGGFLFDGSMNELTGPRVEGSLPGDEDEVSGADALRVSTNGWRTGFRTDLLLGIIDSPVLIIRHCEEARRADEASTAWMDEIASPPLRLRSLCSLRSARRFLFPRFAQQLEQLPCITDAISASL